MSSHGAIVGKGRSFNQENAMQLCLIDKMSFVRYRRRIDPEQTAGFVQTVDALVSLAARGRVSVIVSPPLSVDERMRVHAFLRPLKKSATMFEEKIELRDQDQEIAYERTIIA
jgi:hypothetical protein